MRILKGFYIVIIFVILLLSSCDNGISVKNNDKYALLSHEGIVYNDGSCVRYEYFISDMDTISDFKKGKERFNNIVSKWETENFSQLSTDGKKVLVESVINNNIIYQIYNDKNEKIFELNIDNDKYICRFSPQLNYYILFDRDDTNIGTLYDIKNNKKGKAIYIEDHADLVFSEDENYFGYSSYDGKSENIIIHIYNLDTAHLLNEIKVDGKRNSVFITQIHNSQKVLYMYENSSYIVNFDGTNKKLLGTDIFFPHMSNDEKLLAYSKVYENQIYGYVEFDKEDICSEEERGLYIKDLTTGDIKFLAYPDSYNEAPVPVAWVNIND